MNQTVFTTHRLDRISGNYGAVSPFTINNLYPHSRLGLVSFTDRRMSFRSFIIFVYFCTKPLFIIYFVLCVYMRSKGRLICQPVFHICVHFGYVAFSVNEHFKCKITKKNYINYVCACVYETVWHCSTTMNQKKVKVFGSCIRSRSFFSFVNE